MTDILPLSAAAPDAVENLLDAAFGTDRRGRTAYRLRAGVDAVPELSFATFDESGALAGSLQCWPIQITPPRGQPAPLVLVGPVAVRPELQRDGIGRALMTHMLAVADGGVADALVLIGDPEYYGRFFGFTADYTGGWDVPGPIERRRLLARLRGGPGLPTTGMLGPRGSAASVCRAA